MEHNFMKGQASIEFLLIILIGVLFITTIVIPNVENAENRVTDVSNFAKLTISADKLSKSIQYVSLAGNGSKQTIQLVVPSTAKIECVNGGASNTVIELRYDTETNAFYEGGISPTNKCELDSGGTETIICIKTLDPGVDFKCPTEPLDPGIYVTTITKDTSQTPSVIIDVTKISDI